MKQTDLGLNLTTKRTRKPGFLAELDRVVPWAAPLELESPYVPEGKKGRPPLPVSTMLHTHFTQKWFALRVPTMEEALHDIALCREFSGLGWDSQVPDKSTILRFRHLLEKRKLAEQILAVVNAPLRDQGLMLKACTVVDATLIAAPGSTRSASGERDPAIHKTKNGNQWHFGMKAHVGVDAESELAHAVRGTAANVDDVVKADSLLHEQETDVLADAGYQGEAKRPDATDDANRHVAMRSGKRRALDKTKTINKLVDKVEPIKASVCATVEHPFRVIKRQFGHLKVRDRGLKKNNAQLRTLFTLSDLWMPRADLLVLYEQARPKAANAA